MAYVTTREMMTKARKEKWAVGAFNAENMEMVQAIISSAEKMHSPVIIQTTPGTLKYADPMLFSGMVTRAAKKAKVPVALHLDHGNSFELAEYCIKEGYSSVMIDGSLLPFEENIALSRRVVEMAEQIPVEAELGTVGGKEDSHSAGLAYTDPDQAEEFVRRTGVFSFAPAIGTSHGVYKAEPNLDLDRLSTIAKMVGAPLVLHGTSGVHDETVRECIRRGISKVNYATDLRITFTKAVQDYIRKNGQSFDPKKYLGAARTAVEKRVCELIRVCGSERKA